jgi:hypothetical protein
LQLQSAIKRSLSNLSTSMKEMSTVSQLHWIFKDWPLMEVWKIWLPDGNNSILISWISGQRRLSI